MNKFVILSLLIFCLCILPSCKKTEQNTPESAPVQTNEAAPQTDKITDQHLTEQDQAKPTPEQPQNDDIQKDLPSTAFKCPENSNDPDGLYRNFFDCSTPYPMLNGKAAKYDKSWKKGDEGAEMDGYIYEKITTAFIDDYRKSLENAGFVNDRPNEAPPIYQKRVDKSHVLRIDLTDDFCKEWLDNCDHDQKIGQLTVQTAIIESVEPEPPVPSKPALNADELKAAYNDPADPEKLYAGLPKPCIFPMKDGKAIPYADKTDLLDQCDYPDDPLFYAYGSTKNFDAADYVESHFYKQLEDAGFQNGEITTKDGYCRVTMEGGEGEFDLRFYIKP